MSVWLRRAVSLRERPGCCRGRHGVVASVCVAHPRDRRASSSRRRDRRPRRCIRAAGLDQRARPSRAESLRAAERTGTIRERVGLDRRHAPEAPAGPVDSGQSRVSAEEPPVHRRTEEPAGRRDDGRSSQSSVSGDPSRCSRSRAAPVRVGAFVPAGAAVRSAREASLAATCARDIARHRRTHRSSSTPAKAATRPPRGKWAGSRRSDAWARIRCWSTASRITPHEWARMLARGASLVWCPASNDFLFGRTVPVRQLLDVSERGHAHVCLGSDSRVTGARDLLDELRAAAALAALTPRELLRMVTTAPADVLRIRDAGRLIPGASADLIVIPLDACGRRRGVARDLAARSRARDDRRAADDRGAIAGRRVSRSPDRRLFDRRRRRSAARRPAARASDRRVPDPRAWCCLQLERLSFLCSVGIRNSGIGASRTPVPARYDAT